ncbi:MAG: transposase zinc-binding domain-containing protein [Shewanella sp.]
MLFRAIKHLFTKDKLLSTLLDEGYPFRPVELENLAKILTCGTSLIGGRHYQCSNPDCPHEKIISMSCKSRLCNSCGQKGTENWIRHQGGFCRKLRSCCYILRAQDLSDTIMQLKNKIVPMVSSFRWCSFALA